MKKTQSASDKYAESMKKQGFIKSAVWIPQDDKGKLSVYANRLRTVYRRKEDRNDG